MIEAKKSTASFGLFDSATPNFSGYYPEVTKQDLDPDKDKEGFVYPVFRALSQVTVRKDYDPVDFSDMEVLKNSLPMILGLAIYPNHEMGIGNELGVIVGAEYQEEYTTEDGIKVPGGLNVRIKLDGKSNPHVARAVMMNPPSIHSSSVTVEFAWRQSHLDMPFEEFRNKVGTRDDKGELIRRVATKIRRYYEMSFVPHGADPFAQRLDKDGKIVNPLMAQNRDSFSEQFNKGGYYNYSFKDPIVESLTETPIINKPILNTMKEKWMALAALMAIASFETLSEVDLEAQVRQKMSEAKTGLADSILFKAQLVEKDAALATLKEVADKVTTLEAQALELKAFEDEIRGEAIRCYKLAEGDKFKPETVKLLEESKYTTLKVLAEPFTKAAIEAFTGKCNKCGSKEITLQNSESGDGNDTPVTKTDIEIRDSFSDTPGNKDFLSESWA